MRDIMSTPPVDVTIRAHEMNQRDISKTDNEQGLYERYRVERIDGRTDEGGGYFVLRTHNLTNDKPETAALRAYAAAVRQTHPRLAADIEAQLPDPAPSINIVWVRGVLQDRTTDDAVEVLLGMNGYSIMCLRGDVRDDDKDAAAKGAG